MAQAAVEAMADPIPPASGAPLLVPPPPPVLKPAVALKSLSELIFETQEFLPEGLYLKINDRMMTVHRECVRPTPPEGRRSDILDRVREHVMGHIGEINELRDERDDYQEQLQAATVRIDHLEDRSVFHGKCVSALKGVCVSSNIPDVKLLEAYNRHGIKQRVLKERELKRKRDEEGVPPAVIEVSEGEEDSDED